MSPEEKLLRIIKRRPKKKDDPPAQPEKAEPARAEEPKVAVKTDTGSAFPKFKNIIIINKALISIFIVLIVYFLVDYFFLPAVKVSPPVNGEAPAEDTAEKEPVKYQYSYYQKDISGKDLFKPLVKDVHGEEEAPDAALEDIAASLGLMGVVSGAKPQAIIEDRKSKKTYFLNKGDKLGNVQLKEILEGEGKVILIYKGREFDLVL